MDAALIWVKTCEKRRADSPLPVMILRSPSPPSRPGALHAVAADAPTATVPAWLRRAVADPRNLAGQEVQDVAILTGAALGALDAVVRRQEPWAGAWRQRLALKSAVATVRQAGRAEDETALRDAVLLTKAGDDAGPAGRMYLGWLRLVARPAGELLAGQNLAVVLEGFGHDPAKADMLAEFAAGLRECAPTAMLTGAFAIAGQNGLGPDVGCWLVDALLAQRMGWAHAVPLLGTEAVPGTGSGPSRRAARPSAAGGAGEGPEWMRALLAAQARAALHAIDLSADLRRRAERLLAIAPKLRARGAEGIIERLLGEDALVASRSGRNSGISDRGLRRLFDRLVELDAVRELTGRPAFRVYGL